MKYFCCIEYPNGLVLDTVESTSKRDVHRKARECMESWNKNKMTAVLYKEGNGIGQRIDSWKIR